MTKNHWPGLSICKTGSSLLFSWFICKYWLKSFELDTCRQDKYERKFFKNYSTTFSFPSCRWVTSNFLKESGELANMSFLSPIVLFAGFQPCWARKVWVSPKLLKKKYSKKCSKKYFHQKAMNKALKKVLKLKSNKKRHSILCSKKWIYSKNDSKKCTQSKK